MPRWAAILGGPSPGADLRAAGAVPARVGGDPAAALGTLEDERRGRPAGPWRAGAAVAVGEVTLWDRAAARKAAASAGAPPPPPDAPDGAILTALLVAGGPDALRGAHGAYALCLADAEGLLVVRDAVGERTLFHTRAAGRWAASSSLRALTRPGWMTARPALDAIRAFLTFAYVPGADTLIEGVNELRPGRWLRLRADGGQDQGTWWEPSEDAVPDAGTSGFRARLEAAVSARLPAGEPVAVLLSGGIDSSAVTALAARLHDAPVRTWAVSFGAGVASERGYAELVAAHCATEHRTLSVTGRDVADRLADAMTRLDDPVGDPLTVPNLLLDEAIAAAGHTVLLNGEGGDPVLGGPKNLPMLVAELQPSPEAAADPDAARAAAYLRSYRKLGDRLDDLLTDDARAALAGAPPLTRHVAPYLDGDAPMRDPLHRLLHANLRTKGAHHILPKVDRLTSSAGLEGRSPLFDVGLVEAAFALPAAAKLNGVREKAVLKDAVADLLPATIVERPKSGMRVPVQAWLEGPLADLGADLLLGERTRARGILRPEPIEAWLRGEGSLWRRQGQALWLVLSLELWLRAFVDGDGLR